MEPLLELAYWRHLLVVVPCAAVLMVAACIDAWSARIPNWLTYPAFPIGLVVHTIGWGWSGLGAALLASLIVFVGGVLLLLPGWMGGGDVKLLTGLAAFVGLGAFGEIMFYAVWVGFFLGLAVALINGYFLEMWRRIGHFFVGLYRAVVYRTPQAVQTLERDERAEVPFGVAIFIGFVLTYTDARYGWPGLLERFLEAI